MELFFTAHRAWLHTAPLLFSKPSMVPVCSWTFNKCRLNEENDPRLLPVLLLGRCQSYSHYYFIRSQFRKEKRYQFRYRGFNTGSTHLFIAGGMAGEGAARGFWGKPQLASPGRSHTTIAPESWEHWPQLGLPCSSKQRPWEVEDHSCEEGHHPVWQAWVALRDHKEADAGSEVKINSTTEATMGKGVKYRHPSMSLFPVSL